MNAVNAIRIVNVDYYMALPIENFDVVYSDFRAYSINQVPVIRIFGSTNTGKKMCLHVHGVFPYLYIPYDGSGDPNALMYQIASSLDRAINISFGQASSTTQHIYKVTLVSGIPFYGYHSREHQFFKIFLYNPGLVRKVANLLQSEAILGKFYQPHESHIPFILQFMIDHNLHGMNMAFLSDLQFRSNQAEDPKNLMSTPKLSNCELEGDCLGKHIANRFAQGNLAANPGIAALWEDERQRRRDQGDDSQIGPCLTLKVLDVAPTKSHNIFKRALIERLIIYSADTSNENLAKVDLSTSVYPAETPCDDSNIMNASMVSFHSPISGLNESTLNESLNETLNATLSGEARDLFEVLQHLGGDLEEEQYEIEKDSVLSQVVPKEEDEEEDDLDLSMPLAMTPSKIDLDTTLVQMDGNFDESSSSDECGEIVKKSKKRKPKFQPLPIVITTTPSTNSEPEVSAVDKAKRKLTFSQTPHNITATDESVVCHLKHHQSKRQEIVNFETSPNKKKILNDYFDRDSDSVILNKPPDSVPQNTPRSNSLSVSELYDIQNNYRSKQGCSTKLTQSSDDSIPLSGKKLTQSSEDSLPLSLSLPHEKKSPDLEVEALGTDPFVTSSIGSNISSLFTPKLQAPTRGDVIKSLPELNIAKMQHQTPYYSDVEDVSGSVEVGYSVLKIPSKTTIDLNGFQTTFEGFKSIRTRFMETKVTNNSLSNLKLTFCRYSKCTVTPLKRPPNKLEVNFWANNNLINPPLREEDVEEKPKKIYGQTGSPTSEDNELEMSMSLSLCEDTDQSQTDEKTQFPVLNGLNRRSYSDRITGVSLNNTYGFKMTPENYCDAKAINEAQHLTVLVVELHIRTRGDFKPDPASDSVRAIFYSILEDNRKIKTGMMAVNGIQVSPTKENRKFNIMEGTGITLDVSLFETENELFVSFVKFVLDLDPDILGGYETEMLSWGYLFERGYVLNLNLPALISRVQNISSKHNEKDDDRKVPGRILLNTWRLLRHEIALQSYTFENIAYHILHKRVPFYEYKDLNFWWEHKSAVYRHRTASYYVTRVDSILDVIEQLDLLGRTSELARLFGIQFYEVLSRGSQFRVESMMLRLAKPLNYIPVSPSVQQRAKMKAPEYLPLILEPESKLYVDPVIVLDFQSLYPSMIIAYNYCFSTCLGKVEHLGKTDGPFEFAATQYKISKKTVSRLIHNDYLNFSPCGVAFVKSNVRDGIMPKMLREILDTRLMVKNSMKRNKNDKLLQKVLFNRQLGLKLIANVTYGYTAANFSGRMPAVEIADSVVAKGRETLQRAIALVDGTTEWGAKVVYGDTDSLFVVVPGKSRSEAFEIGSKIAEAVTNDNPDPVKLKLEKVYQPCILQTKKRYVGYMYENADQDDPVYEAKGIETVRRDGCPAVSKMLEKCLRLLFETKNVSLVKQYVLRQFHKIFLGRVSIQDLTFAKEYRGAAGYRPGACVPALEIARKWTAIDKRSEPRSAERVPYVIANGHPGLPLIRLVHSPRDFLNDPSLRPNAMYYITRVIIPPINRCFVLIGADLNQWFSQMPRAQYQYLPTSSPGRKATISQYFMSVNCITCSQQTQTGLCEKCRNQPQSTTVIMFEKMRKWESAYRRTEMICESCSGISNVSCVSLDCPVLYRRIQTSRDLQQTSYVRQLLDSSKYEF